MFKKKIEIKEGLTEDDVFSEDEPEEKEIVIQPPVEQHVEPPVEQKPVEPEVKPEEPAKPPVPEPEQPKQKKNDVKPLIQEEGESKRRTIVKLLEQGKSRKEIFDITGYVEKTIEYYVEQWMKGQTNKVRELIADGRWNRVRKIIEMLEKKETFLVQDGKLYYPGQDRLAYVFLTSTIGLICLVVYLVLT